MTIKHLNETAFKREIKTSKTPVLVDFHAEWCGPCRALGPVLEELAKDYSGNVEIAKVNVDDEQRLAQQYGVRGVPTMIVFKDGEEIDRFVGYKSKQELSNSLARLG